MQTNYVIDFFTDKPVHLVVDRIGQVEFTTSDGNSVVINPDNDACYDAIAKSFLEAKRARAIFIGWASGLTHTEETYSKDGKMETRTVTNGTPRKQAASSDGGDGFVATL